jgi:uncharacterized OB-fold protein
VPNTSTEGLPQAPGAMFEAFLKAGNFSLQWCSICNRQIFFPRTICPHCGSNNLDWRPASGHGVVYSTTIVRQRPERGGDYNVAIIQLAEGARMLSRVEGVAPPEVRIGMTVAAVISEVNGTPLVIFRPTDGARS